VSFRNLEDATNAALELFGNKHARGVVLLEPFQDYYDDYLGKVAELLQHHPPGQQIIGESAQKDFIVLFGAILRLQNILTSFDDFEGQDPLTERQAQDYRSLYLDFYAEFRKDLGTDRELINDDVVFEIELIKQVEINVDYILMLVEKYRASFGDGEDKKVRAEISRAVDASPSLRSKRDLVEDFVDSVSVNGAVDEQWQAFVTAKREAELEALIVQQNLRPKQAREFIEAAFRDGQLRTTGTGITKILPPVSRFASDGGHGEKKRMAVEALTRFFVRFFGLGAADGE
jgi:type I restriction enzyme R subunit